MMARPKHPKMDEIVTKFELGQGTATSLAREYGLDRSYLHNYFKKNGIRMNQQAKEAVTHLTYGYSKLQQVIDTPILNQHLIKNAMIEQQKLNNGAPVDREQIEVITAQERSIELANEVMELVKKANPTFARSFQRISALMLKRSEEILEAEKISSNDIKNISQAVSNMNDTLNVFPKMPTIAQQFNIGKGSPNAKGADKPIDLKIEFVDSKKE